MSDLARIALAHLLSVLLHATPIAPPPSNMTESPEELSARLDSIAEDAAAVASSPADALLILSTANHESAFALDVDRSQCREGTCDHGRAVCLMQIQATGDLRARIIADRRECFRVGLSALHASSRSCSKNLPEDRFAQYASGSCISSGGIKGSRELFAAWKRWSDRYRAEQARASEKHP